MATNLINQLLGELRGDTLNHVASSIGESPARTHSALSAVVPAIFGGLANRTSTMAGAEAVLDTIRQNKFDSSRYADTAAAIKGPAEISSLIDTGRPLLDSIFGNRTSAVADWASSSAGISRPAAASMMSLALPLILGQIGRHMKGAGWSAANLMSLLAGQRAFVRDAPAGLTSVLSGEDPARRARTYHEPRRASPWLWAIPLLVLIPLLAYFLARTEEPVRQVSLQGPRAEVPGAVGTASVPTLPTTALGPFINKTLPNNVALRIPSNGVENRLIGFIEDRSRPASTETWFSFDRLEFDSNSARLTPSSSEQLRNIAEIMKAYPRVKVKVGGHTDNVADDGYNMKLSQERAANALNAIANMGVDRSRLDAEGYGETHPVADNATVGGRQRNRRIDIRVTEK